MWDQNKIYITAPTRITDTKPYTCVNTKGVVSIQHTVHIIIIIIFIFVCTFIFIFMYFVLEGSMGRQLHATWIPAATHVIRYCNFGAK